MPCCLTFPAENQVFAGRIVTSLQVWIPPRRDLILSPGLENQCPPLHTSEANIKKTTTKMKSKPL